MNQFQRASAVIGSIVSLAATLCAASPAVGDESASSTRTNRLDPRSRIRGIEAQARTKEYFEAAYAARGLFKAEDSNQLDKSKLGGTGASELADLFGALRTLAPESANLDLFGADPKANATRLRKLIKPHIEAFAALTVRTEGSPFQLAAIKTIKLRLDNLDTQLDLIEGQRTPSSDRAVGLRREFTRNYQTLLRLALFFAGSGEFEP